EIIRVPIATVIVISPMVSPTSSSSRVRPCWRRLKGRGGRRMASVGTDDLRRTVGAIGQAARTRLDVLYVAAAFGGAADAARGAGWRLQASRRGTFVFAPADHDAQLPPVGGDVFAGDEKHPGVAL